MPPFIQPELAPPTLEWVDFVIDFANSERPSKIPERGWYVWDGRRWLVRDGNRLLTDDLGEVVQQSVWTSRDLDNEIEKIRQWKLSALILQSPPGVKDYLREEITRSKGNERGRSAILKPDGPFYQYTPQSIDQPKGNAEASQHRLQTLLGQLAKAEELTPNLEATLDALIRDLKLSGSAANPLIEIETLDQWWGFPLAALSEEIIGCLQRCALGVGSNEYVERLRRCGLDRKSYKRCSNYFVDWKRGRSRGKHTLYCTRNHERAENSRLVRCREKNEELKKREKAEKQRKKRNRPGLGGAI